MIRKDFIKLAALSGAYLASSESAGALNRSASAETKMTAGQLQSFLTSMVKLKPDTVDKIIIGDPETEVKKIGTCWMTDWDTCGRAVEAGVNVLITHEPTFYTHRDLDDVPDFLQRSSQYTREQYLTQIERKKKWINDHKLVIIRNHDTLDALKDKGIPFAFGEFLGFRNTDIIASRTYYNVYKFNKQKAIEFAKNVAIRLKKLGQPGVAFYGDSEREVSSVGVGTGWICDPMDFGDLKPDVFLAIDDVVKTHIQTVFANDTGHPLLVINHGTSEEMGMRSLNQIIKEKYPETEVIHFMQGCTYDWITAEGETARHKG